MQVFTGWLSIPKYPAHCTTTGFEFFYRLFAAAQAA
jgi:hypothetical protein